MTTPHLRTAHGRTWFDAVTGGDGSIGEQATRAWSTVVGELPPDQSVHTVTEYVTPAARAAYDQVESARAVALGDRRPAVSVVVVPRVADPDADLAIEVTTGPTGDRVPADGTSTGAVAPTVTDGTGRPSFTAARASGDLVHVASVLPLDAHGDVVGGDDLVAQTAKVYANAAALLARLGLGLEDVVKTVEMVKPHVRAAYPRTGFVRKQHLAGPYGGGTGIVQDDLPHPDALIQVDFWASPATREKVDCGWERYGRLTYNPGLRLGDDLFVMSGQAALDVETEEAVLPGDVVAQAEYTYRNITRVLDEAGLTSGALVRLTEYVCPDAWGDHARVEEVRREVLGDDLDCAVTTVGCSLLLRPEFLIEVDPWAVQP